MSEKLYIELWTILNNRVQGEKDTILEITKGLALLPYDEDEDYSYFIKKAHQHGTRLAEAEALLQEFESTIEDPTK